MDMRRSALSLVIHKNGCVSKQDIDTLLDYYQLQKGITVDREKYQLAVDAATNQYKEKEFVLYVCTDRSCLKKTFINPSESSLDTIAKELGCPVETTGCHWFCDQAPTVTFKFANESKSFVQCSSAQSWKSIGDFVSIIRQKRALTREEN